MRLLAVFDRPAFLKTFHKWAAVVAFVASLLGLLVNAQQSIPILYLLSCYAIVTGHWSSYQAAAVESKQDEQNGDDG